MPVLQKVSDPILLIKGFAVFWVRCNLYDQIIFIFLAEEHENRKHICCFFVKAQYHRQGIGRKLWEYVLSSSKNNTFTVHSSPYAVPVYRKLGFVDTNTEQSADGMRYTPMKFER